MQVKHSTPTSESEFTAADGSAEWERRMWTYYGFKPKSPRLPACPRIVAGKRCLINNSDRLCICQNPHHLWDHCRMWRNAEGRTVLTLEPYGIDGEEFLSLAANVVWLGLEIFVEGYSPYYPGHTVLIIIRQPSSLQTAPEVAEP